MTEYKTPGVYVKEISKFPPSVAGVATAIPAFIGVTEKGPSKSPVKIKSLLDFQEKFGYGPTLRVDNDGKLQNHKFVLYDSIRLFYDNGGGICYVVSIGNYDSTEFDADLYEEALTPLKKVDEVTLLVAPDAAMLLDDVSQLGTVHIAMLTQCADLGDRFAILDPQLNVSLDNALNTFRTKVGNNHLSYGAAYYPFLKTTYTKSISFDEMVKIGDIKAKVEQIGLYNDYYAKTDKELAFGIVQGKLLEGYKKALEKYNKEIQLLSKEIEELKKDEATNKDAIKAKEKAKKDIETARDNSDEKKQFDEFGKFSINDKGELLYSNAAITDKTFEASDNPKKEANPIGKKVYETILSEIGNEIPEITNKKALMAKAFATQIDGYAEKLAEKLAEASIIPPSGAIAGIYAATDGSKGVWQAPANISIAAVADVTELISDKDQENMNVDAATGKSVNAIRFFTGKGILVWGARTLDGNSNEWRYVPVRRLFNYIEESVQKSTNWAVFQPNDANTWVKIQCQIENFLINLWRDGALAGSTPDKAFYVKVGLDVTMTADDINNGYLIVEIGLAAVRPAEFIVLKFSHKVQEA